MTPEAAKVALSKLVDYYESELHRRALVASKRWSQREYKRSGTVPTRPEWLEWLERWKDKHREIYPGAARDDADGYIHDTVPAALSHSAKGKAPA